MKNEAENKVKYTAKGNMNNRIKDLVRQLTYKPQHFKPRRTLKDKVRNLIKDLQYEPKNLDWRRSIARSRVRKLRGKPAKVETKRFVAKGNMKTKIKALILAAAMSAVSFMPTYAEQADIVRDSGDSSIQNVATMHDTNLEDSGMIIQYGNKEFDDTFFKTAVASSQSIVNEEENEIETEQIAVEENNEVNDEIKTIYGGEISASENGIRTADEIIYAVTQMGWREAEIENVREMMDGLLKMQSDFDIDPLCALAVFHHESHCGLAYEEFGQHRLANILKWSGQEGVIGYSKTHSYALYGDYNSAAYDFGNYVRNSAALKGAKTMADLESFNGYGCIFNGAASADAKTYNQLKQCIEKNYSGEVNMDDIWKIVEDCTTEDIQEMTGAIKSSLQNETSKNQESKGEKSER